MVDGSTWGRAGRRFFRNIFFIFFCSGFSVSGFGAMSVVLFVVVRSAVVVGGWEGDISRLGLVSSAVEFIVSGTEA